MSVVKGPTIVPVCGHTFFEGTDTMLSTDKGLELRSQQLQEAMDLLTEKHGSQSETVALIRKRFDEVQLEIEDSNIDRSGKESNTGDVVEIMGGPKIKDGAMMFVLLGGTLIFAFGGMSTMFVLMLAAKW